MMALAPVRITGLRAAAASSRRAVKIGAAAATTRLGKTASLATVSSLGIDKATGITKPVGPMCIAQA